MSLLTSDAKKLPQKIHKSLAAVKMINKSKKIKKKIKNQAIS